MTAAVQVQPLEIVAHPAAEDQARADFYAVLARLWYGAPDRALLATLAAADELVPQMAHSPVADAWRALCAAAGVADEDAVRLEYDEVFVGTGKAEVSPFATAYFTGVFKERVLVQLRDELAALGLARVASAREPEDHFAALCDVMRHLVGAGSGTAALERQRQFFKRYLEPAYAALADRAAASAHTRFYKSVASFTKAFLDLEVQSFQML